MAELIIFSEGEIRRDDMCLDYAGAETSLGQKDMIMTTRCHGMAGNQEWNYEDSLLKHNSGFCIELGNNLKDLFMNHCDSNNKFQVWNWKKREKLLHKTP